ncbi:AraC family transcriptional regulator [Photobacterium sp. 2_MG-2023]|uniref:helix-turn-helix domain-containing protein n=1 Tax=Photobacterium sp. 2_MG-2023 TaxID=3062663 RepID=UPI0026E1826A|nr:AraC family transcriptional regulator [Photobacterium sp. 2_MG-2023]MDO6582519.1 AraC family transcriptional regulator [Photobacterium sp. 2_MG-2023]
MSIQPIHNLIVKDTTAGVTQVTPGLHERCAFNPLGWYDITFPDNKGESHFRCFRLAEDVCFTKSTYQSDEPLLSKIDYHSDTTLMVFGLKGKSQLGFHPSKLHTINVGDIWLFNLTGNTFYRYSSAGVPHEMAVLKIPTQRLKKAFCEKDEIFSAIFTMPSAQVAVQQKNQEWIAPLISNPLHNPFDRIKAEGSALELLAHWLVPLAQSVQPSEAPPNPVHNKPIERARHILVSALANPPTLYELAKEVGMSHTRLNRDFKKTYGKTVFCWLRSYRLDLAKTYLKDPSQSITDIAHLCGFSSASHFTHAFRNHEGFTPVCYRSHQLQKASQNEK